MIERKTARVILLNDQNEIFLLKTVWPNETFWLNPGGKIEMGESLLEAAKRKLLEETGITATNFIVPNSFYSEEIYNIKNEKILFKENIFIAYTNNNNFSLDYIKDNKDNVIEAKWWNLDNFIASGETFYPRGILEPLQNIISKKEFPTQPIIIGK